MAEKKAGTGKKPKSGNLSELKSELLSMDKYLRNHGSEIHPYTRAYLVEKFRGIIKSRDEWKEMIKTHLEGEV